MCRVLSADPVRRSVFTVYESNVLTSGATGRLVRALLHEWPAATLQHRRVVAALGRGAWRRLRATPPSSMVVVVASPLLAGLAQVGDLAWLAAECEPSHLRDLTGAVEDEDLLARLRL